MDSLHITLLEAAATPRRISDIQLRFLLASAAFYFGYRICKQELCKYIFVILAKAGHDAL